MLRLIEAEKELPHLGAAGGPFLCRILSTARAYGVSRPFARFWRQDSRAAVCLLDGALVLEAEPDANFSELREFLPIIGAAALLCSAENAALLGFSQSETGRVLRRRTAVAGVPGEFEQDPSPRELYPLLARCRDASFFVPEFEPFYLDLSHRTRHGAAVSVGVRMDGELCACALCTANTEEAAVLSAVAVLPEYRRRGLGRRAVRALLSLLPGRRAFVFRAAGENRGFYESLGFEDCGGFAEIPL